MFDVFGDKVHLVLVVDNVVVVSRLPREWDVLFAGKTGYGGFELADYVRQSSATICPTLHFQIDFVSG